MSDDKHGPEQNPQGDEPNAITPLEGEAGIPSVTQRRTVRVSRKDILTVALTVLSVGLVAGLSIHQWLGKGETDANTASHRVADLPTAAAGEPRKLDLSVPPVPKPSATRTAAASAPAGVVIPAIAEIPDDTPVEPIGVRRTGEPGPGKQMKPEDAPVVLVSSRPTPPGPAAVNTASGSPGARRVMAPQIHLKARSATSRLISANCRACWTGWPRAPISHPRPRLVRWRRRLPAWRCPRAWVPWPEPRTAQPPTACSADRCKAHRRHARPRRCSATAA